MAGSPDKTDKVKVDNEVSKLGNVSQGYAFGPLLFRIYITIFPQTSNLKWDSRSMILFPKEASWGEITKHIYT